MKLGKLPPKHAVRPLRFGRYSAALPPAPATCDYSEKIPAWPMLGNDQYGDCTFAGAAHLSQCWADNAGRAFTPDDRAVVTEYLAFTGGQETRGLELGGLHEGGPAGGAGAKSGGVAPL